VLIICDNTMDLLLPDEGPARRLPLAGMGRRTPMLESPVLQDGKTPDAGRPAGPARVPGVGFDVIEQQPSFLYDRPVLITGEVDRVAGFEKGFPIHQAWRGGSWQPDSLT